jgi:hypothetical protein
VEETTDPGEDNPEDDENEKRGTDVVHDGLEMTLVLGTQNERSSATDERALGRGSGESVSLSTLATGGVVESVTDVLVGSERLSGDGRLVTSDDGVTLVGNLITVHLVLLLGSVGVVRVLVTEELPLLETGWVVVVTDQRSIGRNNFTFLDDELDSC